MKKSFLLIVCAVALVLGFCSCGGNSANDSTDENKTEELKEEELTKMIPATQVKLKGKDCSLFKVAADSVKVLLVKYESSKSSKWEIKAIVPIEATMGFKEYCASQKRSEVEAKVSKYGAKAKFYDSNEVEIKFSSNQYTNDFTTDIDGATETILSGNSSVENIHIQLQYSSLHAKPYPEAKEKFDKVCTIEISNVDLNETSSYSDDDSSDDSYSSSSSYSSDDDSSDDTSSTSTDWDSILDEYENYVDKTIAIYKKVNNGDMNAMSEYTSVYQSAQKLSTQLAQGQSSMTSAQMTRFAKISQKMANAAMKMK